MKWPDLQIPMTVVVRQGTQPRFPEFQALFILFNQRPGNIFRQSQGRKLFSGGDSGGARCGTGA